jgi:purine-binding chemotaxis protein CheW
MKALTFLLHSAVFAVSIVPVREIISLTELTPVPLTAGHLRGVMNLRGAVVPVVDLAARLGLPAAQPSERTSILLVEARFEDATHLVGLLVDAVREVVALNEDSLVAPPSFGTAIRPVYIQGMVDREGGSLTVLSAERILDLDELEQELSDVVVA